MYWIMSANQNFYNHSQSFKDHGGFIDWHQLANYKIGDIVFIYSTKPVQRILYETIVENVGFSHSKAKDEEKYWINKKLIDNERKYCRLRLLKEFDDERLCIIQLNKNGLKGSIQRPRKISDGLLSYILNVTNIKNSDFINNDDDKEIVNSILDSKKELVDDSSLTPIEERKVGPTVYWKRNSNYKALAIKRADYKCEVDSAHVTFLRRNINVGYTEAHHLIPLYAQSDERFKNVNLDCPDNIVSLCSNCHNQLHYGKNFEDILRILYYKRKDKLRARGINITFEELMEYYK